MRSRLSALKYYNKNVVVGVLAVLMLVAYVFLSPWQQFNPAAFAGMFPGGVPNQNTPAPTGSDTTTETEVSDLQAPAGFEAPEGFEAPAGFEAPEGIQLPEGFDPSQLPEGFDPSQLPEGFDPSQMPQGGAGGGFAGGGLEGPGRFLVPLGGVVALIGAVGSAVRPRYNRLATALAVVSGIAGMVYFIIFFVQDAVIPINLVDMATPGFWIAMVSSLGLIVQVLLPRPRRPEADEGDITALVNRKRPSAMSLRQNVAVSFDALMANKLRSALTMLGIVIGVASVVSLLSVGRGAQASVTEQISGTGLNLLTISSGAGGGGPGPGGGGGGNSDTLTYEDALAIEDDIEGITAVMPQYSSQLQVRSDQESYMANVLGTVEEYAEERTIAVEIGRYFSESEYRDAQRVAVLGSQAAQDLFGGLNPIGRDIRVEGKRFEVVGVLEQQDGGFGNDPNLQVYIPLIAGYRNLFDARATASNDYTVSSIVVAVEDIEDVEVVTEDVEALLRDRHRLEADEDNDFNVVDQQSLLDIAGSITGILTVLLGAIASISLLVGGIGIMNITLVSVTERTKEIGLRKAIGARRSHILQQFLIETIVLSLLGGFIGVALGVLIALVVDSSGLIDTTITADTIALGLGFSAIVGVFFGVYPANQAASLEPIEALRYE